MASRAGATISRRRRAAALVIYVAALVAAHAELEDECQADGISCDGGTDASAYLQTRRDAPGQRPSSGEADEARGVEFSFEKYPQCSEAARTCDQLTERIDGQMVIKEAEWVLQGGGALVSFLTAVGADMSTGMVHCPILCAKASDFLAEQGYQIPTARDVGCYPVSDEDVRCDYDLSPERLNAEFSHHSSVIPADMPHRKSRPAAKDAQVKQSLAQVGRGRSRPRQKPPPSAANMSFAPWENPFALNVREHESDIALRLLYLMRIYPLSRSTYRPNMMEHPYGHVQPWGTIVAKNNLVSRAYLNTAIMEHMRGSRMDTHGFEKWFGKGAASNPEARGEVLRVMNSIMQTINSAEYQYSAKNPNCFPGVYAFVFPHGAKGVPNPMVVDENSISTSPSNTKVVTLCDYYFEYPDEHARWESVQTTIHEASHHGTAYTEDVALCKEVMYLQLIIDKLTNPPLKSQIVVSSVEEHSMNFTGSALLAVIDKSISGPTDSIKDDNDTVYEATFERFSQDGSHVLAVVSEVREVWPRECTLWGDLVYAYGEQSCQQLAREQPFKAFLNADNFGYYIVDVAEHFFAQRAVERRGRRLAAEEAREKAQPSTAIGAQARAPSPH